MSELVALYRAVNVGRRRLPMDRLRAVHLAVGATNVRTVLASGNVLFARPPMDHGTLVQALETAFEREAGFASEVILRDRMELRNAVSRNPFLGDARDPKRAHTVFLRERPTREAVRAFLAHEGPEELGVDEREAFVYYTDGFARSKVDLGRLGVTATARNANTVAKLLELLGG
jgi:uncharacterized protein (DUF1697 family)